VIGGRQTGLSSRGKTLKRGMTMPIVGQQWGQLQAYSRTHVSHSQTVQIHNRNISAEIALCFVSDHGSALITQIVSNAGVEQPMLSIIGRSGTTSITFTHIAIDGGSASRWIVNHWE
jgi:hypothetical protein